MSAPRDIQGDWHDVGRTSQDVLANANTSFFFLLHQRNLDELERLFQAVSDPQSPEYGKFKSPDEIRALTAAPQAEQDRVLAYLHSEPVRSVLRYRNVQSFGDTVEVQGALLAGVEQLLGARFHDFQSRTHPEHVVRRSVQVPRVPPEVADVVPGFIGLTESPPVHIDSRMEQDTYERLRALGHQLPGIRPVPAPGGGGGTAAAGAAADAADAAAQGFTLRSSADLRRAALELSPPDEHCTNAPQADAEGAAAAGAAAGAPAPHRSSRRHG